MSKKFYVSQTQLLAKCACYNITFLLLSLSLSPSFIILLSRQTVEKKSLRYNTKINDSGNIFLFRFFKIIPGTQYILCTCVYIF